MAFTHDAQAHHAHSVRVQRFFAVYELVRPANLCIVGDDVSQGPGSILLSKEDAAAATRKIVEAAMTRARIAHGPLCAAFVDPSRREIKVPPLSDDVEQDAEGNFVGKVALFVDVYGSEVRCVAIAQITARVVQITLVADKDGVLREPVLAPKGGR